MELADSTLLWWLVPALALLAMYAVAQRRRAPNAVPHPAVALLRAAMATRPSTAWRRHLPAASILIAMTLAAIALARPALRSPVPRERT